jgi:hypothetical protein
MVNAVGEWFINQVNECIGELRDRAMNGSGTRRAHARELVDQLQLLDGPLAIKNN